MIPNIGPAEIIVVLIIAVVVLGPKKLPAAGRSLGGSLREFKNGITGNEPAVVEAAAPAPVTPPAETAKTEA
jgi:sec-independent protein translocase protein TatA